jgi:hypothetical protein
VVLCWIILSTSYLCWIFLVFSEGTTAETLKTFSPVCIFGFIDVGFAGGCALGDGRIGKRRFLEFSVDEIHWLDCWLYRVFSRV